MAVPTARKAKRIRRLKCKEAQHVVQIKTAEKKSKEMSLEARDVSAKETRLDPIEGGQEDIAQRKLLLEVNAAPHEPHAKTTALHQSRDIGHCREKKKIDEKERRNE